jgi:hypothetical protein
MDFADVFAWSEVWLPLIPLGMLIFQPKQPDYIKPVVAYLCIAVVLNLIANIIWLQQTLGLSLPTDNNNPIYNVNSILRLLTFSLFFLQLRQPYTSPLKKILPFAFVVFVIFDLLFFEDFLARIIANNIHAAEAGILIIYSLLFYLFLINNENVTIKNLPSFWIVTGLFIFVLVSFPIYIFYKELIKEDNEFAIDVWEVQKAAFMIFCIFTAIGFYNSGKIKLMGNE